MPLYPTFDKDIRQHLGLFLEGAAYEAADIIRGNLRGGRNGRWYPHLPNRSAARSEFPAEQFGDLVDSIGYRRDSPLSVIVGSISRNGKPAPREAYELEMRPNRSQRKWLSRTMEDPATQRRMNSRGKEAAK